MPHVPPPGRTFVAVLLAASLLLLVGAVLVRGYDTRGLPRAPEDRDPESRTIAEPLQLLSRGSALRIEELTPLIAPERRDAWDSAHLLPFRLAGCPKLLDWIDSSQGQRFERLLGELRRGSSEEALAALALIFQLARSTEWDPGLLARTQHSERLGGLLQEWLRVRAEDSAKDPLLHEPALAGALLYGRVMRTAYDAPAIGRMEAPYERAKAFLWELTRAHAAPRTQFGESLLASHPRAMANLLDLDDFLRGFDEEARLLFPELDGECGA